MSSALSRFSDSVSSATVEESRDEPAPIVALMRSSSSLICSAVRRFVPSSSIAIARLDVPGSPN